MSKLAVLLLTVVLASATASVVLVRIGLEGYVKVGSTLLSSTIILNITSSEGYAEYDLGYLRTEHPVSVRAFARLVEIEGVFSGSISFNLLINGNVSYNIGMPCAIVVGNASCARILVVIPGYDVPLTIEGGEYTVRLIVRWSDMKGEGRFKALIGLAEA